MPHGTCYTVVTPVCANRYGRFARCPRVLNWRLAACPNPECLHVWDEAGGEEEWGYLAGIVDGEGYLGPASRGAYYRLTIVQKADAGLLEALRQIFEFCWVVVPFVMVKRQRVLEVVTHAARSTGGRGLTRRYGVSSSR
jgi:hypothetical protein